MDLEHPWNAHLRHRSGGCDATVNTIAVMNLQGSNGLAFRVATGQGTFGLC